MIKFRRIILVTGTPGVGKTSISTSLASVINAVHIDLGKLVEQERIISGLDKTRETLIVDIDKVIKRVQRILADHNCDIIMDGHYAVNVIPADDVYIIFVLRRDPDELRRRMKKRGFIEKKICENLAAEILDVCLWEAITVCGSEKVCEIDTSGKSIEEVVGEMVQVLERKDITCKVRVVDWLGKLEKDGRLDDFF